MNMTFFLDEPNARAALRAFAQSATDVMFVCREETRYWDGEFPTRVGDYFYNSPWVLYSSRKKATPILDLFTFSADHFKSPKQVDAALGSLGDSVDWCIFSWGGYAKYGMLGLAAREAVDMNVRPVFQYKSSADFSHSFKGLLGRRTRMEFAPPLWRAINGELTTPLVVTFAYYADAFEGADLSFSVEGTFAVVENEPQVSAYRVHDYATFAHFVGLVNQVYPFDVLPGTLSLDACQAVRRAAHSFDLSKALDFTPWYLVYNGGEIDTNHALFVASDHAAAAHFAREASDALSFVTYF
jgi:hypothetical protein